MRFRPRRVSAVTRATRSAIEQGPALLVATPLVVEHEFADLIGELCSLPLAYEYTERLKKAGIAPSRGRTGTALDNAMAESVISTLKRELISRYGWPTRLDLELALVTYIGWYNARRRHRSLKTRRNGRTTHQAPLQVLSSYNAKTPVCLASK